MIFIKFSFLTRERDRWCVLKRNEKWKKMKKSILECLFQKIVIYTQVSWEWKIRSETGAFDTLAFPHIYRIIHTNLGQSYFQYLCHPSYNTRAIQFHLYPCYYIFFFTLPRQAIPHTSLIISLVHTNWGNCKAHFPLWRVLYTTLIVFWTRLFITSKCKANIANPTHQNWSGYWFQVNDIWS